MIPVTIARLENYPGFMISLDKIRWWKSLPLPDDVSSLNDAIWIYGQYHVCSALLANGNCAIFQSKDNGYSWVKVLETSEVIKCLVRPDYGMGLAATSGGWWRSVNAGTDWVKISTMAPGCHIVKELTRDILVALDGTYIWRSIDSGTTWTKAVVKWTSTAVIAKTNHPSVDGTFSDCFVGCTSSNCKMTYADLGFSGPFSEPTWSGDSDLAGTPNVVHRDILLYSSDGAESFVACEPDSGWAFREALATETSVSSVLGVTDYMENGNGWQIGEYKNKPFPFKHYEWVNLYPRDTYNDIITDIELTGINRIGLPQFVVQVEKSDGKKRHYWVRRIVKVASANKQLWVVPVFDAVTSMSDSLCSEEVQITGSTDVQRMVLFSGKTSTNLPLLKSSVDGGNKWTDNTVSDAEIYSGPDLAQLSDIGGPFLEDSYIAYSWHLPLCHNGWNPVGGKTVKYQSYDADILFRERVLNLGYPVGFTSILSQATSFDADYISQKILTESVLLDFVSKKEMSSSFVGKYISRGTFDSSVDDDMVVMARRYCGSDYDMLAQKAFNVQLGHRAYVRGTLEHGTGSNIVLAQTHFPEIYVEMERGFPQQWDIPSLGRESKLSYKRGVMDTTRTEEE